MNNLESLNSRRKFLKISALAGFAGLLIKNDAILTDPKPFVLPILPYSYAAFEPMIDAKTMEIHYSKHHGGYVDKLNALVLKEKILQGKTLEYLLTLDSGLKPMVAQDLKNYAGGHWNHTFYWNGFTIPGKTVPGKKTISGMTKAFGGFDGFIQAFEKASLSVFGSGWVWLTQKSDGTLAIHTTPNQDNPLMPAYQEFGKPVFGVDVWEHAYYLKYQNRRIDYIKALWNIVNWEKMESLLS